MISEASGKQFKREDGSDCPDSQIQVISPSKKISRPIIKSLGKLFAKTLNYHLVKRIKAKRWLFLIHSGRDNAKILKTLKFALRSNQNAQQLDFIYEDFWNDELMEAFETGRRLPQYQSENSILQSYSQNLRGQSSLKKISFSFKNFLADEDLSEAGMSYIKRGFSSLTSLRSMKVDCGRLPDITEKSSQKRIIGLKMLRNLQRISFDFRNNKTVTAKGIEKLFQGLKRLPHLQEIGLKFGECEGVTGPEFEHFCQTLKTLSRLQRIEFDFFGEGWDDEKMAHIAQGMQSLVFLSHFKLRSSYSPDVTKKGFFFIGLGLRALVHLKSLEMDFFKLENITTECLSFLGLGVAKLRSLQKMSLSFTKCGELTGTGMQVFSLALKALCSLQTLEMRFHDCGFSETEIHGLSQGLKNIISLKNLTLTLIGCDLTEAAIQYLHESWTSLPLERIELEFVTNTLNDAMVEELGKSLNQITSLKNVSVEVDKGKNVTMAGRNGFFQALAGHQCLKKTKFLPSNLK